jgi:hypothetical protein
MPMISSPRDEPGRITLDKAPPLPPRTATRQPTIMDAGGQPPGMGQEGGNPQVQALMAAQQVEQGFRQLVELLPGTAQVAAAAVSAMRQLVAEQLAGTGQPSGPGPGMAMAPPPPPGGMAA